MEIRTLRYDSCMEQTDLVLCIGFFDGMHIAHQSLAKTAVELGKTKGLPVAMMTFSTQVLSFIKNEQFRHLTSLDAKIAYAEALNFDAFYVLEVDQNLVDLEAEAFIAQFLSNADTLASIFRLENMVLGLSNCSKIITNLPRSSFRK